MPHRDLSDKPDKEYILDLAAHIDSDWFPIQSKIDKRHKKLFWNEHDVKTTNTKDAERVSQMEPEIVTSGEAAREVNLAMSFYARPAPLGLNWIGEGSRSGDKDEYVINEIVDVLNPASYSPRRQRVLSQILLGRGIDFILDGRSAWWDFPDVDSVKGLDAKEAMLKEWRRVNPVPISWMNLPAENTFPAGLSTIDDEVLSRLDMSWYDLMEIFSEEEFKSSGATLPDRKDFGKEVTLGIYSNREYVEYVLFLDNTNSGHSSGGSDGGKKIYQLRSIHHEMGRSAIRILPGITGVREVGKYWISLLHHTAYIIEQADHLLSLGATGGKSGVQPAMLAWLHEQTGDAMGAGQKNERRLNKQGDFYLLDPGDPTQGREREDIKALFTANSDPTMLQMASDLLALAGRMTHTSSAI